VPSLRKFGRRARIIELSEQPEAPIDEALTAEAESPAAGSAAEEAAVATISRDHDGVELGELSVTEAPEPRPAPRFDGKVLHRPESNGGRLLPWLVWGLIAIALVVLIVLLLTGVLGPDAAATASPSTLFDLSHIHPVLEEPAA
ncbi:MAG: hypothetical protein L0H39_14435, partial [Brachybacterium sp.]|nr:hypothetical protein [Brachybacterium sp.]